MDANKIINKYMVIKICAYYKIWLRTPSDDK